MANCVRRFFLACVCLAKCAECSPDSITDYLGIIENHKSNDIYDGIPQELKEYINKVISENDERHDNEISELKQHLNRQDSKIERLELEVEDLRSRYEDDERSTWNDENTYNPQTTDYTTADDNNSTENAVVSSADKQNNSWINAVKRNHAPEYRMLYP